MNRRKWRWWNKQYSWPILQIVGKFLGTRKLKRRVVLWLGKTAKLLFIYLFFSLYYTERSVGKCYITSVTWLQSHDGKVVHRPYSSCISSIQKIMGTPLSSSCQLRLGG